MKRTRSPSGREGFTLLEIAVVLAMIGTLAAVAVPAFSKYIRKAKTSEPRTNLESIRALARSYYLDHRSYPSCPATPAAVPGSRPARWTGDACWDALGFRPDTHVLYQYETGDEAGVFFARARGDLDDDGELSELEIRLDGASGGLFKRTRELE